MGLESRSHLMQMGQILPSQDETQIGMGHEIARTGHDISVSGLSDLNALDNFPDVFQIDFCPENTHQLTGKAFNGNGDRIIGLRAPSEINRPQKGSPFFRRLKGGLWWYFVFVFRENGPETRRLEADVAGNIKHHDFLDRRGYQ